MHTNAATREKDQDRELWEMHWKRWVLHGEKLRTWQSIGPSDIRLHSICGLMLNPQRIQCKYVQSADPPHNVFHFKTVQAIGKVVV